ncbi:hypothetical protein E1262_20355 [Jiangella aurantiaca]|uniref:SCP domain-containing protein n=1 Tax=Jiangella aurantiaca TaxID=2530373 RepID=A0A4R5A812_9ACTN|nr:CAP domain-containing protein [Jiangella aurantiaca]TDD66979.1 hypothetical protein E1262_20355 [Jiangella aurantiaca]
MPLLVRAGLVLLVGCLAVAGLVLAITDGPPVLHARAEGGSRVDDFTGDETPRPESGTSPSGTPTEPAETPSPSGSESPSPEESDDTDGESGGGFGGSDDDSGSHEDDLTATTPPREPDSPRPTDSPEPTDEPSEPSEEPTDEPSEDPSDEPTDQPTTEPSEEPTEDPDPPLIDLFRSEEQLLESADESREEAGCPALRIDPRLTVAAREHSEDMRERLYFSHVNPDGETPQDRAADEGYTAPVGENLSHGLRNAEQVVRDWKGEERDRLLDCSYTSAGVGVERGLLTSWWTLMLGTG